MTITLTMEDKELETVEDVRAFLAGTAMCGLGMVSKKEKYEWVEHILLQFRYQRLRKKDRTAVKKYVAKVTGYSKVQTKRLVSQFLKQKKVRLSDKPKHSFAATYTTEDVTLLAETDNAHLRLSGPATKAIFKREFSVFGRKEYERLAEISISHLYNLRGRKQYSSAATVFTKTRATKVSIGVRKKPDPGGIPGHLRVDSVHQGDRDKEKGVYHINLVDEVTQWEIVIGVEGISEYFLLPALEAALDAFPFKILGFHSDNGSEYINQRVAELLEKLFIEQTKSRSRRSNDNALVETKNGSVIRKHMGYRHIPKHHAGTINAFYREWFNTYLNFHRPCGFATVTVDVKGKEKKVYDTYETPYEKLRSLPDAARYLKPGIAFEALDLAAKKMSDTEYAILMQKRKVETFKTISP